jgi:hypothetical protein
MNSFFFLAGVHTTTAGTPDKLIFSLDTVLIPTSAISNQE